MSFHTRTSPRRKVTTGTTTGIPAFRGKRTGVQATDTADMDEMFQSAFSPVARNAAVDDDDLDPKLTRSAKKRASKKTPRKKKTPQPARFSLDGQETEDEEDAKISSGAKSNKKTTSENEQDSSVVRTKKHISRVIGQRKAKGATYLSPSMMSDVDTLGPETPAANDPEAPRAGEEEEEEEEDPNDAEVAAINAQAAAAAAGQNESPMAFPMNDDDDDEGDDLMPPVQPDLDDDEDDEQEPPAQEAEETSEFPQPDAPEDEDQDEDHNEGPGFEMADTPASAKEETSKEAGKRGRKKKKRRESTESTDEVTPAPQRKKRSKKQVTFSPKGYPTGNREYENVPLSELVEPSPDDPGVRRSKRARVKPLEFWRNERIEYGPTSLETDSSDDEEDPQRALLKMDLPEAKQVIRAKDTPYRKRKVPEDDGRRKKGSKAAAGKNKSSSSSRLESVDAMTPCNTKSLRRQLKISDGSEAPLFDMDEEEYSDKGKCT